MKYCMKCGTANEDTAKFCMKCGNKLVDVKRNTTPPAAEPAKPKTTIPQEQSSTVRIDTAHKGEMRKPPVTASKSTNNSAKAQKKSTKSGGIIVVIIVLLVILMLLVGGTVAAWKFGLLDPFFGGDGTHLSDQSDTNGKKDADDEEDEDGDKSEEQNGEERSSDVIPESVAKPEKSEPTEPETTGPIFDGSESQENQQPDQQQGAIYDGTIPGAQGDYILAASSSRLLVRSDVVGLTKEQLRIARNEIYARNGRKFTDEALQAYFNGKSWYRGTIDPSQFTDDMLSSIELKNLDFITTYEKEMGYR